MAEQNKQLENIDENATADLKLSGEMVEGMKDKSFTIQSARSEMSEDLENKTLLKKKILLIVSLADGSQIEAYCNKTSQKTIAAKCGVMLRNWAGFKGEFFVLSQMVGDVIKKVVYIK